VTEITLEEFSANVDEFVWRANAGEEFTITAEGRPIGMLLPPRS
jgi:prevent-host-death family protein